MNFLREFQHSYQAFAAKMACRRRKKHLENQIINDIHAFISKNCSNMAIVADYRKKLTLSIQSALGHISGLIDQIPGPEELAPKFWNRQPMINSLFLKEEDVRSLLKSGKNLKPFFARSGSAEAIALLTASQYEKTVFGIETSGEMARRDVPKKAVYYDSHQILAPAETLADAQYQISRLVLVSLCSQSVQETAGLRAWKKELEAHQHLLEFKLNEDKAGENEEDLLETTRLLSEIKRKVKSINNQVSVTREHLERICDVFEHPEKYLTLKTTSLKLDRMGIRLDAGSRERANEFSIAEFQFGQAPKKAGIWVRIIRENVTGSNN